ncbi:MAG TPA: hypothetical protein DHU55_05980 [Blastocatellia bacterium]|nr:hypothetical protein [Blastocatellia bacterium]HCX29309.1 hypothetical protein [Blastocatellia bacterium]
MDPEVMDYPPDGTLEDLSTTCGGDEDGLRAKLVKLERAHDNEDNTATRATYEPVPIGDPYVSKELFFFDITDASPQEIHDIAVEQLAQGHALAFPGSDNADVYLNNSEAQVAVYREG